MDVINGSKLTVESKKTPHEESKVFDWLLQLHSAKASILNKELLVLIEEQLISECSARLKLTLLCAFAR